MSRLTLRLPESLHDTLAHRAEKEGVSLNQYLVYTLTRTAALDSATAQRAKFEALRSRFSEDESERVLATALQARAERQP